jgi:uncharacterized protein YggE
MNRRVGAIAAIVLVSALVLGFAANAMGDDATPAGKPTRTISVSSTATVKATPDEAVVNFGVRTEDPDSAKAFAQNAEDMTAVLEALAAAGIDEKKDIQTLNVGLDQRVENRGTPNEQRAFVATNSVQVKIRDLDAIGDVIDAAVQAGADSVNDIRFELSDPNAIRTDALTQAVQGARTKVDALAAAAGADVLGVVSITEDAFRQPVYRAPYDEAALFGVAQAAAAPTPIATPDSLQVSVTVSVVWEIG